MSVNIEFRGQSCAVCSTVLCEADTVTINEDILGLLKVLLETIDTSALQNMLVCSACLEKINEAVQFKTSHLEKQETNLEIKQTDSDGKFAICCICKNASKQNSSIPLLNSYEDIVSYIIPKKDLNNLVNPQICDGCQISILNFQSMTLVLSIYDLNKTSNSKETNNQLHTESITDAKIDITDKYLTEGRKSNVGETENIKLEIKEEIQEPENDHLEDFQIKQEELDLKMDYEADPSNEGETDEEYIEKEPETSEEEPEISAFDNSDQYPDKKCDLEEKTKQKFKPQTQKIFVCEECDFETKDIISLKTHTHMETHIKTNDTKKLQCTVCGFQTKHKRSLAKHVINHRNVNETEIFKCSHCKYQSKQKYNLSRHMISHRKDVTDLLKCNVCEYRTKFKNTLSKHLIVHKTADETELFKCNICKFQTKYKGSLTKHLHNHKISKKVKKCESVTTKT